MGYVFPFFSSLGLSFLAEPLLSWGGVSWFSSFFPLSLPSNPLYYTVSGLILVSFSLEWLHGCSVELFNFFWVILLFETLLSFTLDFCGLRGGRRVLGFFLRWISSCLGVISLKSSESIFFFFVYYFINFTKTCSCRSSFALGRKFGFFFIIFLYRSTCT